MAQQGEIEGRLTDIVMVIYAGTGLTPAQEKLAAYTACLKTAAPRR
jgi:hypothetical protein